MYPYTKNKYGFQKAEYKQGGETDTPTETDETESITTTTFVSSKTALNSTRFTFEKTNDHQLFYC